MTAILRFVISIAVFSFAAEVTSVRNVTVEKSDNPSNVKFIVECELPQNGGPSKLVNVEYQPKDQIVESARNSDSIADATEDKARRIPTLASRLKERIESSKNSDDSEPSASRNVPEDPTPSEKIVSVVKNLFPSIPLSLPALPIPSLPKISLPDIYDGHQDIASSVARAAKDSTDRLSGLLNNLKTPASLNKQNEDSNVEASNARNVETNTPKTLPGLSSLVRPKNVLNLPKITLPQIPKMPASIPKNDDSNMEASAARNVHELIPSRTLPKLPSLPIINIPKLSDLRKANSNTNPSSARNEERKIPSLFPKPTTTNPLNRDPLLPKITLPPNIASLLSKNPKKDDLNTAASGARNVFDNINPKKNSALLPQLNNLPTISRNANTPSALSKAKERLADIRESLKPIPIKPVINPANIIPSLIPDIRPNPLFPKPAIFPIKKNTFPDNGMSASNQRIPSLLKSDPRARHSYDKDNIIDHSKAAVEKAVSTFSRNANALANGVSATLGNAVDTIKKATYGLVPAVNLPAITPKKEIVISKKIDKPAEYARKSSHDDSIVEATNQKDTCDICNCLMKYLPQGFKDGKFVIDKDDEEASASEHKPAMLLPPKSFYEDNADMDTMPSNVNPVVASPIDSLFNSVRHENHNLHESFDHDISSSEKIEQMENNIYKLIEFVNIVDQFDQYISEKTKYLITRLSKMYEDDFRGQIL